jgi:hypothetical protein
VTSHPLGRCVHVELDANTGMDNLHIGILTLDRPNLGQALPVPQQSFVSRTGLWLFGSTPFQYRVS